MPRRKPPVLLLHRENLRVKLLAHLDASDRFAYYVKGPRLRLAINPADVFPHYSKQHHLYASEKE
jgi:hypothetical protein